MSNTDLINELQQAEINSKTGRIVIFGILDGATKGLNIDIHQGKITKISLGDKTGMLAAKALANIIVERVKFMESGNIVSSPEGNTPDIATLLGMIAESDNSADMERLVEATIKALEKIMGPSSKKLVEDIAEKFPPTDNEQLYIENCKQAVVDIIGRKQTEKLFTSLQKN